MSLRGYNQTQGKIKFTSSREEISVNLFFSSERIWSVFRHGRNQSVQTSNYFAAYGHRRLTIEKTILWKNTFSFLPSVLFLRNALHKKQPVPKVLLRTLGGSIVPAKATRYKNTRTYFLWKRVNRTIYDSVYSVDILDSRQKSKWDRQKRFSGGNSRAIYFLLDNDVDAERTPWIVDP